MKSTINQQHNALPAKIRAMIDGGAPWELYGYPHKFAARKAVLYAMIRAGWTRDDAYRCLMLPDRPGYDLWDSQKRRITPGEVRDRFHKDWSQAAQHFEDEEKGRLHRPDVLAICGELRALADAWRWQDAAGRGWRNYKAVVLQGVTFAEKKGSLVVGMPVRKVGEDISLGDGTVVKYLKMARRDDWMTHLDRDYAYGRGHVYRLNSHGPGDDVLQTRTDGGLSSFTTISESLSSVQLCNTKRAQELYGTPLGDVAGKARIDTLVVLAGLCESTGEPRAASTVAAILGTHRSTIGRHLEKLGTYYPPGLVRQMDDKRWMIGISPEDYRLDPDPGRVGERKARHEDERRKDREVRAEWLEELHQDSGSEAQAA